MKKLLLLLLAAISTLHMHAGEWYFPYTYEGNTLNYMPLNDSTNNVFETIRRLTIPEGIKRINAFSFINCEPLVTVTLPSTLESIGTEAFSGCSGLQRDIFPDINTYLGVNYDSAEAKFTYGNDSKIYIGTDEHHDSQVIDWPSTITKIPDYAFYDNHTLQTINIPETVTEIGIGAFYNCWNLSSVTIPNSVSAIGDCAFHGCTGFYIIRQGRKTKKIML